MGGLGQAWLNRLSGTRHDDSCYEFVRLTVMEYTGDGQFSLQEAIYDWEEVAPVLRKWVGGR